MSVFLRRRVLTRSLRWVGRSWTGTLVAGLLGSAQVLAACLDVPDTLMPGAMHTLQISAGEALMLDGEPLDVDSDGWVVFGLDRDASGKLRLERRDARGQSLCEQSVRITQRDYDIQFVEGVPQETVTPPPEVLERIRRETEMLREARAQRLARSDFLVPFRWPAEGRISGVYGSQRVYNGTPGRPHYGVDVAAPTGTPIRAPAPGKVTLAHPDMFYSGGTVILDHGYGVSSAFLHMSKVLVEAGAELKAGDLIGEVGATGRATGPHLDWRMNWRDRRIDPALLVPPMPSP